MKRLNNSSVAAIRKRAVSLVLALAVLALLIPFGAIAASSARASLAFAPPPAGNAPNLENASFWAHGSINEAYAAGLVPSALQSAYTQAVTRAEFSALAVALYEKLRGEIMERSFFDDVSDVNVQKAAAVGVVDGVGDGKFDPDSPLTREQAATMLARLAAAAGNHLPRRAATFSDNSDISSWALDAVGQVQAAGIMDGMGGNMFLPEESYTREQSIVTIMRTYYVIGGAAAIPDPEPPPEPTTTPSPDINNTNARVNGIALGNSKAEVQAIIESIGTSIVPEQFGDWILYSNPAHTYLSLVRFTGDRADKIYAINGDWDLAILGASGVLTEYIDVRGGNAVYAVLFEASRTNEALPFNDTITFALVNAFRVRHGATPLNYNAQLYSAAQAHSKDMNDNNFMNHFSSSGQGPAERITAAGYRWTDWGENITMGSNSAEILHRWVLSNDGHRELLYDTRYVDAAVSTYFGSRNYTTLKVAAPWR